MQVCLVILTQALMTVVAYEMFGYQHRTVAVAN